MATIKKLATTTKKTNNQYYIPEETDSDGNVIENSSNANSNAKSNTTDIVPTNQGEVVSNSIEDTLSKYLGSTNSAKATASESALDQYNAIKQNSVNTKQELYQTQQNANKYNQNLLANQGLSTQGVAQSTNTGANNTYLKGIQDTNTAETTATNDVLKAYNTDIANADTAEQEQNFNLAQTALSNVTSIDDYDSILSSYKGKVSDYQYSQLKQAVNTAKQESILGAYGVSDAVNRNITQTDSFDFSKMSQDDFQTWIKENTKYNDKSKVGSKQYLWTQEVYKNVKMGNYNNGDVIDLNYGGGTDNYVYYNGVLYKVSTK